MQACADQIRFGHRLDSEDEDRRSVYGEMKGRSLALRSTSDIAITPTALGFIFCVMNRGHIYFEIQADDPARAISFYSRVFGWKFEELKGLPVPYWRIETGGSRGGLLKRPAK